MTALATVVHHASHAAVVSAAMAVTSLACGDGSSPYGDGETSKSAPDVAATASAAASASAVRDASATTPPAPEPRPSASAPPSESPSPADSASAPKPPSFAAFRAEGARDPASLDAQAVALDVMYVRQSQREFGYSTEHAGGRFVVLHVALPDAPDDLMACQLPMHQWPPAGVLPGVAIRIEGRWTFDRMLRGGTSPGGGPLEIWECKVTRR